MSSMICSPEQFAAFRIALGLFLVSHFLWLVPYAGEIYGPAGMYPEIVRSPFPNFLALVSSDGQSQVVMGVFAMLAALFTIGLQRRWVALMLWYGWACLTNRVPFLYVPSEGLVGWLLLFCVVVPAGEPWSIRPRAPRDWKMPTGMLATAWIVLGVGYLASGIDKLSSPSWQEGNAIRSVLTSPIARWDELANRARELPDIAIHAMSWAVLAIEISYLFLIWNRWTRLVAWIAVTVMHLGIRATLNLHTVTDPFLIANLLIFDLRWLGGLTGKNSSMYSDRRGTSQTRRVGPSQLAD